VQPVQGGARDVGRHHHPRARQAVRPYAADQKERDERQELCEQDDSDIRRVVRQVGDEQGERDDHDAVTHRARALREPEVAEVVVSQNAQALSQEKETTSGRPVGTLTRLP
jgi:hypothetical protein